MNAWKYRKRNRDNVTRMFEGTNTCTLDLIPLQSTPVNAILPGPQDSVELAKDCKMNDFNLSFFLKVACHRRQTISVQHSNNYTCSHRPTDLNTVVGADKICKKDIAQAPRK